MGLKMEGASCGKPLSAPTGPFFRVFLGNRCLDTCAAKKGPEIKGPYICVCVGGRGAMTLTAPHSPLTPPYSPPSLSAPRGSLLPPCAQRHPCVPPRLSSGVGGAGGVDRLGTDRPPAAKRGRPPMQISGTGEDALSTAQPPVASRVALRAILQRKTRSALDPTGWPVLRCIHAPPAPRICSLVLSGAL